MANETVDNFDGNRREAIARLQRLVKLACERLPVGTLNLASYHLAVYLDNDEAMAALAAGRKLEHVRVHASQMTEELEHERDPRRPRRRPDISTEDRRLLRKFGIKGGIKG
jgi:hypothetical protein